MLKRGLKPCLAIVVSLLLVFLGRRELQFLEEE
jgi:hypothetical protein